VFHDPAYDWPTTLSIRARKLWASRHGRAIGVPVAFSRLKEIRGWLVGSVTRSLRRKEQARDGCCTSANHIQGAANCKRALGSPLGKSELPPS
jgi:hypothetical protein